MSGDHHTHNVSPTGVTGGPITSNTEPHIIRIDGVSLKILLHELNSDPPPTTLRVWMDDGGAKFKLDNSTWSPPLGHLDGAV